MMFSPLCTFMFNLGIMYDALTELSDLSRMIQRRGTALPEGEKPLVQIRVFEFLVSTPDPHTETVLQAKTEKSFSLHDNGKIVRINAGQFFCSMAENLKSKTAPTASSHVNTQESSSQREGKLTADIRVLQPDTWPQEDLDIQHGKAGVLQLCDTFKREKKREHPGISSIQGSQGVLDVSCPQISS